MKHTLLRAIAALLLTPALAVAQGTRICLAPATIETAPTDVDPITAVQETFTSFLTGPALSVKPLTSRLQSQARAEAKLDGCPYLLLPTLKHERKSSGGGLFGKMASGAVQQGAYSVSARRARRWAAPWPGRPRARRPAPRTTTRPAPR